MSAASFVHCPSGIFSRAGGEGCVTGALHWCTSSALHCTGACHCTALHCTCYATGAQGCVIDVLPFRHAQHSRRCLHCTQCPLANSTGEERGSALRQKRQLCEQHKQGAQAAHKALFALMQFPSKAACVLLGPTPGQAC
eukprot:scaffold46158_cov23-Tisochrysis_lutea.AAC.1